KHALRNSGKALHSQYQKGESDLPLFDGQVWQLQLQGLLQFRLLDHAHVVWICGDYHLSLRGLQSRRNAERKRPFTYHSPCKETEERVVCIRVTHEDLVRKRAPHGHATG